MTAKYFDEGDKVKGNYYLTPYVGTITNRRCHGMNPNKMVYTITFDAPTQVFVTDPKTSDLRNAVIITTDLQGTPDVPDCTMENIKEYRIATEPKKTSPLISVGTFGLHTNLCPTGRWAFVGTIPVQLKGVVKDTEEELKVEVYKWMLTVSESDFNELMHKMRADVLDDFSIWMGTDEGQEAANESYNSTY